MVEDGISTNCETRDETPKVKIKQRSTPFGTPSSRDPPPSLPVRSPWSRGRQPEQITAAGTNLLLLLLHISSPHERRDVQGALHQLV